MPKVSKLLRHRLIWFALIWAGSVLTLAAVATVLRLIIL